MKDYKILNDYIRITKDAWLKGWHERNGGNLSYRLKEEEVLDLKNLFSEKEWINIGVTVKNLQGQFFIITGSGKFFRNVELSPEENIGIIEISECGEKYRVVWGLLNNAKPTSELPAHLMNHSVKFEKTNGKHRVILHSHTTNLIALTFVLPLSDEIFTRELWEMATECPVVFPTGVGIVPWMVPGGAEIGKATSELMKKYDIVLWAHHGTFCSGEDLDITFGLMDTAEKAAEILVKVLSMGGKRQTILTENFVELGKAFKVTLNPDCLK
ncbi:MAG: rhamnulose-1-phosphate aldolase [Cetobacterium sp.]